ncbi:MAG TPA: amidohydrolase family protein [Acidimicrobiales bacterium]|nr:amidohydrolase family protein [Acidimicrobiales bacterium]
MTSPAAELLIVNGDIVTMDALRRVLVGGAIVVAGGRILAVGRTSEMRARWPGVIEVDARGGVVTPGLVNAHQHITGDPLARSCTPDDLEPGRAIFEWSVPLHAGHTGDDDELSAQLTSAESALNGVTTIVEAGTISHPDRVAAGVRRVGVRATIGTWGWDIEAAPFAAPAAEVLDRQRAVLDALPPGDLVTGWVTLVGHGLASDELLAGAAELARARGAGMTMHLSPTSSDPEVYLARHGRRPVSHLDTLGVLGPHLLLAHGVWFDDAEIDAVLGSGTAIAYCPWAYLRHGQGTTGQGRHAEMFLRGGRIALGCDATNAGDQFDILRVAALAAGLAKDTRVDPTWFGAHEALEMATIRGAEAIGMVDDIGSLEPGKYADIVIHDADAPAWNPRGETALQLLWSADGRTVRDVFVGGRAVVRDGRCVNVDLGALHREAALAAPALLARSGIKLEHRWPHIEST